MRTSNQPLHRGTTVGRAVMLLTSIVATACAAEHPSHEVSDTGGSNYTGSSPLDPAQQVLDFRNQHMTALTDRRDMERILSHFTEDATYLPSNGQAIIGRDAIRTYLVDFFSDALFGVTFDNHQTLVDGDLAILRDTYSMVIVPHSGSAQTQHSGEDVWVLRRVSGEWEIALIMWTERAPG